MGIYYCRQAVLHITILLMQVRNHTLVLSGPDKNQERKKNNYYLPRSTNEMQDMGKIWWSCPWSLKLKSVYQQMGHLFCSFVQ
jgi:hypothetical protein